MENEQTAGYFLSPQQAFTWQRQQGAETQAVAQCAVLLEGVADPAALSQALTVAVARHEILRTVFRRRPGFKTPVQVILPALAPRWEMGTSASSAPAVEQAEGLLREQAAEALDFAEGPLLRAKLVKLPAERALLLLTASALIADEASLLNLSRELLRPASSAVTEGEEPLRYVQFAQWQLDLLGSEEDESAREGKAWWAGQAKRSREVPLLSSARSAETPGRVRLQVSAALTAEVEALAGSSRVEVGAVLLAAWQALLMRLSGVETPLVAVTAAGREYEELGTAQGAMARRLPVGADFAGNLRFRELLAQTAAALTEAGGVQEYLDPAEAFAAGEEDTPGFSLTSLAMPVQAGGLRVKELLTQISGDGTRLRLEANHAPGVLELRLVYDGTQVSRAAAERLGRRYIDLLAAAADDPATEVAMLPVMSAAERERLLVKANRTEAPYPQRTMHALIGEQAGRTPDRLAVRYGDEVLTYGELDRQANRLAHWLRAVGVGAGDRVGLLTGRSAQVMVAVLGVLKAGAAYVPLAADQPAARLALQMAGLKLVIAEEAMNAAAAEALGAQGSTQVLLLESLAARTAGQPEAAPQEVVSPDDLAYVIYTSGSTGAPKGVMVRHRNLVNYSHAIARKLRLEELDHGLQFATVSTLAADLGNTCIYPALMSGGTLHVVSYETATDPLEMAAYQQRFPIDVLKIVPSHLAALVHGAEPARVLPRRFLITGGEALTSELAAHVLAARAGCRILNHYGPTETTVGSLTWLLEDGVLPGGPTVPLGRPIANTRAYVLDGRQQPVPEGIRGELYLGGAGVAAGYLDQPERTAERFLPDPFVPGATVYRTGDVVRFAEDGSGAIEFLGRADDQVKIRGFRVEPGEVAAALTAMAGVRQAYVLARPAAASGEVQLVAYVVAAREGAVEPEALKDALRLQVPEYMVPAALVLLPRLPLTKNGKVDRQALPEPGQAAPVRAFIAPEGEREETIAAIWAEVLGVPRVSVEDNFFALGGHSLMATQVISRVRERLRVEVPLRALFEAPTVRALALAVGSQPEVAEAPIRRAAREAYRAETVKY